MGSFTYAQRSTCARDLLGALIAIFVGFGLVLGGATAAQAADKVKMPKVVGQSADDARDELGDLGFKVKLKAKPKSDGPVFLASNWKVSKQSVKAGKQVKEGKNVTLTVKKKPKTSASPSASPAPSSPLAAGLEADLKRQWGVTNFSDGLVGDAGHDPSLLNWTISEINDQSAGIVHVTIQVTSLETSDAEVKQLAKNIMRLEQDSFPALNWIVVQTADGQLLEQSSRLAAGE